MAICLFTPFTIHQLGHLPTPVDGVAGATLMLLLVPGARARGATRRPIRTVTLKDIGAARLGALGGFFVVFVWCKVLHGFWMMLDYFG